MARAEVNGLSIAYDDTGTGNPIIMINGLGADRSAWHLQVPALAREFRTITFDNRDVGETGPSTHDYTGRQFADDTVGLMESLGIDRAHIVGASMGGSIAQEMAINYPDRVRTLTLVCSWPSTDPWLKELLLTWENIFAALGPAEWARAHWPWVFTHRFYQDQEAIEGLKRTVRNAPNPQSTEMYRRQSQAAINHDARDELGQISAPTHVICGEEDIFIPLRFSRELVSAIPGAMLTVIPEAGHGMFWEATDEFNEAVLGFIRER